METKKERFVRVAESRTNKTIEFVLNFHSHRG